MIFLKRECKLEGNVYPRVWSNFKRLESIPLSQFPNNNVIDEVTPSNNLFYEDLTQWKN